MAGKKRQRKGGTTTTTTPSKQLSIEAFVKGNPPLPAVAAATTEIEPTEPPLSLSRTSSTSSSPSSSSSSPSSSAVSSSSSESSTKAPPAKKRKKTELESLLNDTAVFFSAKNSDEAAAADGDLFSESLFADDEPDMLLVDCNEEAKQQEPVVVTKAVPSRKRTTTNVTKATKTTKTKAKSRSPSQSPTTTATTTTTSPSGSSKTTTRSSPSSSPSQTTGKRKGNTPPSKAATPSSSTTQSQSQTNKPTVMTAKTYSRRKATTSISSTAVTIAVSESTKQGEDKTMKEQATTTIDKTRSTSEFAAPLPIVVSTKKRDGGEDGSQSKKKEATSISSPTKTARQLFLDMGQKNTTITCDVCGMLYSPGVPQDELTHKKLHQQYLTTLRWRKYKLERVVQELPGGARIVMVRHGDPQYKKAESIRAMVDKELGFAASILTNLALQQIYLYISRKEQVLGCVVAEGIQRAFRLHDSIPSSPSSFKPSQIQTQTQTPQTVEPTSTLPVSPNRNPPTMATICRSPTISPPIIEQKDLVEARVGISRVWVCRDSRRKGIASKLVDAVRANFIYGEAIPKDLCAFSQPTRDGVRFAAHYTQTRRFLIYLD
eukprot:TRINITY_DN6101_c0_g1_i1.p1 TRINITY_DN6101_c0_g1~~TRINITY_DN6101_c0_g1_i1.p1  ORF type:complete len:602 (-),score=193.40 TRINITY_DN6101_c0_g1_i1:60-1865(-)